MLSGPSICLCIDENTARYQKEWLELENIADVGWELRIYKALNVKKCCIKSRINVSVDGDLKAVASIYCIDNWLGITGKCRVWLFSMPNIFSGTKSKQVNAITVPIYFENEVLRRHFE